SVVHGPNLNLLGQREPEVYGTTTLAEVDARLKQLGAELGAEVQCWQANGEGALVDRIQALAKETDGYLVNLGAYTHTSIALLDALVGVGSHSVEVNLSKMLSRVAF